MSEVEKVMVVAGRAKDISDFVQAVNNLLFDNFKLIVAQPVEEEKGVDEKVRCVGFVICEEEMAKLTMNNQASNLKSTGLLGARIFPNIDEAMEYAKSEYGFDTGEGAARERAEQMREVFEKFKPFDSDEVEFFSIFDSLMETNKIMLLRGKWEDKDVCLLAMQTPSEDGKEIKISVMGMLLNTPELREMVETPYMTLGG